MSGRILITGDIAAERIVLKAQLARLPFAIVQAADGDEAVARCLAEPPDLVILPALLGGRDWQEVFQTLRRKPGMRTVPMVLRAPRPDYEMRIRALQAGLDAVVDAQEEQALLLAHIRTLLRRRADDAELLRAASAVGAKGFGDGPVLFKPVQRLAFVTPDFQDAQPLCNALAARVSSGLAIHPFSAARAMLSRGAEVEAIVMANTADAPEQARQLIADLRCIAQTRRAAIVFVNRGGSVREAINALEAGADDVVHGSDDADEIALHLRRALAHKAWADGTRAALSEGLRLANTDALTGLANRRAALARLDSMASDATADGSQYALMIVDLDHFKAVNDRYGHAAGDAVLVEVARRMDACTRNSDVLARFGGEEFLVAIPNCAPSCAEHVADRIRYALAQRPVTIPGLDQSIAVTASIGLAMSTAKHAEPDQLLEAADKALYAAKAAGRNTVKMSAESAQPSVKATLQQATAKAGQSFAARGNATQAADSIVSAALGR
ncbi:MAG: diguanylate cyclase [Pseudomonadota bacterium]